MLDYVVVMPDDFRAALAEFEARLDRKLDQRFTGLRLDERFAELRLDERFAELRLDERFAELRLELDERFAKLRLDERFAELRQELDERFTNLRLDERFAEVKKEIQLVYDGVVGVNERVGALELKFDLFEERVEQRFGAIATACRPDQTHRTRPRRRR
jgi:hypothetical protein